MLLSQGLAAAHGGRADMAILKSKKRENLTTPPDPAPFDRLVEQGLADPAVVAEAYAQVYAAWVAAGGQAKVEIVQERPEVTDADRQSVGSVLIWRRRMAMFLEAGEH